MAARWRAGHHRRRERRRRAQRYERGRRALRRRGAAQRAAGRRRADAHAIWAGRRGRALPDAGAQRSARRDVYRILFDERATESMPKDAPNAESDVKAVEESDATYERTSDRTPLAAETAERAPDVDRRRSAGHAADDASGADAHRRAGAPGGRADAAVERERDQATEYMQPLAPRAGRLRQLQAPRPAGAGAARPPAGGRRRWRPRSHALDSLERAFLALPATLRGYTWIEGIALVELQLRRALELQGIRAVAAEPGQAFDPARHEPIGEVETREYAEGAIAVVVAARLRVAWRCSCARRWCSCAQARRRLPQTASADAARRNADRPGWTRDRDALRDAPADAAETGVRP